MTCHVVTVSAADGRQLGSVVRRDYSWLQGKHSYDVHEGPGVYSSPFALAEDRHLRSITPSTYVGVALLTVTCRRRGPGAARRGGGSLSSSTVIAAGGSGRRISGSRDVFGQLSASDPPPGPATRWGSLVASATLPNAEVRSTEAEERRLLAGLEEVDLHLARDLAEQARTEKALAGTRDRLASHHNSLQPIARLPDELQQDILDHLTEYR